MHGVKRVIIFCILIVILPATLIIIPLYLRKFLFADVLYNVAESDIIEIRDGISSIFCQQHSLRMSTSFNAFQLRSRPEISTNHKHIRLKKSMTLPDDTLEYWGFYLLKGAKVNVKFCSRYDGSRILVVKGERNLKTCGLMEHNKDKFGANYAQGHEKVEVFFEDKVEVEDLKLAKADDENHAGEELDDEDAKPTPAPLPTGRKLKPRKVENYSNAVDKRNKTEILNSFVRNSSADDAASTRHHRHKHHIDADEHSRKTRELYDRLYREAPKRQKRDQLYDRHYSHGGNALNFTEADESNSISSFENGLLECYNGQVLSQAGFPPSAECTNVHFLENGSHRMLSKHEVVQDGYYYYIFYSDNDLVRNDIHAIFDIYKPTFQYSNLSDSHSCINATNCTFPISFLSDEIVVVEVPTKDGIEHEEDDYTVLISTCHPRTYVYAIFPISVLVLILSCAFL